MLLVFGVVMAPLFSLVNSVRGFETLLWLFLTVTVVYYSLAYYQLYARRGLLSFLSATTVSAAVFAVLLFLAVLLLRIYYTVMQ